MTGFKCNACKADSSPLPPLTGKHSTWTAETSEHSAAVTRQKAHSLWTNMQASEVM